MTFDFKPFLKWFGYTRRERRSSFILLLILFLTVLIRYLVPSKEVLIEDFSASLVERNPGSSVNIDRPAGSVKLFTFDPNRASSSALISLGFSDKQTGTIVNYRQKGGRFRSPSDMFRIYGVDSALILRLIPYIIIERDTAFGLERKNVQFKKTELNRSDSTELDKLPGIGPVLASRIIKYRKLLGGYVSVIQLKEVYGLTDSTYRLIAGRVTADSLAITFININTAGFKELIRHPYFERYDVQAILKYRELKGKITGIAELLDNKIISREKAQRVRPYLLFDNKD
jgi:competence protein ComEA